jgi:hypothetical protein
MTNQEAIKILAADQNITTIKKIRIENIECYHTGRITGFYVELDFTSKKEWGSSEYEIKAMIDQDGTITRL